MRYFKAKLKKSVLTPMGRKTNPSKLFKFENERAVKRHLAHPEQWVITPLLEKPHAQQTAAALHYLFSGLYDAASNKGVELSALFATGQDSIVYELFDYAEAIELYYLNGLTQDQADSFPGVYQYELVQDRLGSLLLAHIEQAGELPPLNVWREMIAINTEQWIKDGQP